MDYEKAFDRVQHDILIDCFRRKGLGSNDFNVIEKLCWQQTVTIKTEWGTCQQIKILKGVRQGYIMSLLLFNLYSEEIFVKALSDCNEGIKINGEIINNIRYADDTVIIAESQEFLQRLLNRISETRKEYVLNINVRKTKVMAVSEAGHKHISITVNNMQIQQVNRFKYLGCWITENLDPDVEVRTRVEYARNIFSRMSRFLCNWELTRNTRYCIVKCYIYSVLLYGMEA